MVGAVDKAVCLYLARLSDWAGIGEFGAMHGVMTSFHLSDAKLLIKRQQV